MCVCVCVLGGGLIQIQNGQCVCRLSRYKTIMCMDYPNTEAINDCVDYPNTKQSIICVFVGYPNTKQSVSVCGGYPNGLLTLNFKYPLVLHPPLSIWRFKSSEMLCLVNWKTLRFRRSY